MRALFSSFFYSVFLICLFTKCSSFDSDVSILTTVTIEKKQLLYQEFDDSVVSGITNWMPKVHDVKSVQGADCFKSYVCLFCADHSNLQILDMINKEQVSAISLPSLGSAYHCNNVDFSSTFYDENDFFPLLYSSHQGKNARCVLVDRLFMDGGKFKAKTIQRIDIPYEIDEALRFTPDALIDNQNKCLYVYTGNTIPITDFYIFKFRLPMITEGAVRLTKEDIMSAWVIQDNPSYYKQGGIVKNNILYIMEGVPGWNTDNIMRVIDLNNETYTLFNLTELYNAVWEPEDIFIYDENLYVLSSGSGIFLIEFNKPFLGYSIANP